MSGMWYLIAIWHFVSQDTHARPERLHPGCSLWELPKEEAVGGLSCSWVCYSLIVCHHVYHNVVFSQEYGARNDRPKVSCNGWSSSGNGTERERGEESTCHVESDLLPKSLRSLRIWGGRWPCCKLSSSKPSPVILSSKPQRQTLQPWPF